ncbi:hypothetical protein ALC57_14107 [Trachymyrmex cornetzi]|uniref:Uncharacterized protein n=1 Tax=Trachymyrmex cornetzi TaxID=471704 RepID=A0A151IYT9_9HYME|nr:hypothetical protein ALC57_14107 [Trachymyrmex cornetzi]
MEVEDAIESDHHPLVMAWKGGREKGKGKRKRGEQVGECGMRKGREGKENESRKETEERIREVLGSIEKERGKERKGKEWRKGNKEGERNTGKKKGNIRSCQLLIADASGTTLNSVYTAQPSVSSIPLANITPDFRPNIPYTSILTNTGNKHNVYQARFPMEEITNISAVHQVPSVLTTLPPTQAVTLLTSQIWNTSVLWYKG